MVLEILILSIVLAFSINLKLQYLLAISFVKSNVKLNTAKAIPQYIMSIRNKTILFHKKVIP